MDIPSLSMTMSSAKLAQDVGISMMKKAIDQTEQTGEQIVEMMKTTSVPQGSTIDIKL